MEENGMSLNAPDRIWAWFFTKSKQNDAMQGGWTVKPDRKETEYVRRDVSDAAVADAKAEGMREAARIAAHRYAVCEDAFAKGLGPEERHCALEAKKIESAILAAIPVTK